MTSVPINAEGVPMAEQDTPREAKRQAAQGDAVTG